MKRIETPKKFRCRGSLWGYIRKSTLGDRFITIERDLSISALQKYGTFTTAINVLKTEIPSRYLQLLN